MPRLEQLRRDLVEATPEEIRERIRRIREDRRVPKTPTKVKKSAGKQKDKALTALKKLSPAELEALLKEMGDE